MIDPKMPSDEAIQQIARQAGMTPEAVRKNYETVFGASTPVESEKLALDALVSMVRGATERAPEAVLSKVDLILGALMKGRYTPARALDLIREEVAK